MLYRVSYFSAWQLPEHYENMSKDEMKDSVWYGKQQQFKVVVTTMDE